MRTILVILCMGVFSAAYSQVITEEEFRNRVKSAQENASGAHESVVYRTNESFAGSIWGKPVRFNDALVVNFFNHTSAQKIIAGVDLYMDPRGKWAYPIDQQPAADLLKQQGLRISQSSGAFLINARQSILQGESTVDGQKIILELYSPKQEFLEVLRIGRAHSIEFMITGAWGSPGKDLKVTGILTAVNAGKQVLRCANNHEYDSALGYKFCPRCGEPLKQELP